MNAKEWRDRMYDACLTDGRMVLNCVQLKELSDFLLSQMHAIEDATETTTTLTAELSEAKGKLERAVECLTACRLVLTPATLGEMGGMPDLFCPDVEAHGFICEPGEDYWDTWDRYAKETIKEITAILQDNPGE